MNTLTLTAGVDLHLSARKYRFSQEREIYRPHFEHCVFQMPFKVFPIKPSPGHPDSWVSDSIQSLTPPW